MDTKKFFMLLMIMFMLFTVSGCGGSGGNTQNFSNDPISPDKPAPAPEKKSDDIPITPVPDPQSTDRLRAEIAIGKISIGYQDGDNANSVTKNLTLPTSVNVSGDVNVSWSSNAPSVISNSGIVTRPSDNDVVVSLTAKVTVGYEARNKTFTVTVLYKETPAPLGYTVSFDTKGGSKVASIRVIGGGTIEMPENPTLVGYVFAGWYKDEAFTESFKFGANGDKITKDTTLYAQWLDEDLLIAEYSVSKIAIGYANGDGSKHVTKNLMLPVKIDSVNISWSSSSGAVKTDGTVTRQAEDVYVTLTATATYNGKSAEPKTFSVRVIRKRTRDNSTIEAFTIEEASSGDIEVTRNSSGDITDIEGQYVSFDIRNADDALDAVTVLREELGIRSPDKELETFLVTSDAYGAEYQFQQTHGGVKVFGRALMASANSSNKGDFLHSTFLSSDILEKAEMKINISSSEAEKIAQNNFGGAVKANTESTEIVVYSLAEYESKPVFAYVINVEGFDREGSHIDENVFVNAQTGSVICSFTNIQTLTGTGRNEQNTADLSFPIVFNAENTCYYMRDLDLNIRMYDGSDDCEIYSSETDFWPDGHQNSAYTNFREIMEWWRNSFNRNSLDNKGKNVKIITHQTFWYNRSGQLERDNAAWYGSKELIVLCDLGDERLYAYSPAVGIDSLAHETAHAVVFYDVPGGLPSNNANYITTGSMNEGYADIFGCIKDQNWVIDERLYLPKNERDIRYLRNISFPNDKNANDKGPSKISEISSYEADTHPRSLIVSHAAYLMHQDHISGGLTWEELGQVWYKSLHLGLSSKSDFNDVRRCVVWAARKCKLAPASKYEAIDKAFDEVGITVSKAVLYGTITDYDTSKPISGVIVGALVGYSSSRANTDSKGYFSIFVNEGNAFIYTIANGYVPFVAELKLLSAPLENSKAWPDNKLDVRLVRPGAGSISGTVKSATITSSAMPIEGVTVKIRGGWNNQEAGAILTTTTDSNGQYTFDLGENGAGYYTIEMSKDGRTEIFNVSVSGNTTIEDKYLVGVEPAPISPDIPLSPDVPVVTEDITIDEARFPDTIFREYVRQFDTNSDGTLSEAEIANVTEIIVSDSGISSLQGVEYFTALQRLECSNNQLTDLDVSKNTALEYLNCNNNQLTALNVSKNTALLQLYCGNNQLAALDVSKNTELDWLWCSNNQLTALDVSKNTVLYILWCTNNQLTDLDVSKNTELYRLSCGNNHLTALDVSKNTALMRLYCENNQLTALDVSKNTELELLYCGNNQLTTLDVSKNTALGSLHCENNQLTTLDLSNCHHLNSSIVYCDDGVTIIWPSSAISSASLKSPLASTILAILPEFTPTEAGTYTFTVSLDHEPPEGSSLILLSDSEDLNASFAMTNEVETVRVSADFTAGRLYAPVIVAKTEQQEQSGGCNSSVLGILLLMTVMPKKHKL